MYITRTMGTTTNIACVGASMDALRRLFGTLAFAGIPVETDHVSLLVGLARRLLSLLVFKCRQRGATKLFH